LTKSVNIPQPFGTPFCPVMPMKASANTKEEQPTAVRPMLATLVKQPFVDSDYVFEVKWDGYRIIAICRDGKVRLLSRGGEDYTRKYPSVVKSLEALSLDCVIDGEVVFLNPQGKPDFDALQKINGQKAPVVYYAFDLLWLDGKNLMHQPLLKRKEKLESLLTNNTAVKYSAHFDDGVSLFDHVQKIGMEGIVAKRKDSHYIPDDRSKKWLKITTEHRQEFVIGGWVESTKRNTFRTLLFGAYENGKLKWRGHAGGGFKDKDMPVILDRLKRIEINQNPFDSDVEYSEGKPHWVKPELVANIKFATQTRSGKIRKPAIFLGFRDDKKASQVEAEVAKHAPRKRILKPEANAQGRSARKVHSAPGPTAPKSNWPMLENEEVRNREVFEFDGCKIPLHNVDRMLWKEITKADLIQYYYKVSKFILPHIQGRPLSLHLKPKGANAPGFYIKDMEGRQPECAEIFTTERRHKKAGMRDVIDYLVCNNAATLIYMVNLGCIDINPWTSNVNNSLHPDFIVVDLDPSDGDFGKAVETARAAKEFLEEHKLKSFPKTSGKTGIHLFVPCSGLSFSQARTIAENICDGIHALVPSITTTEVSITERGTKLYLDPNQNDYADTVASAYSVRPYKFPLVSAPLEWREVRETLDPEEFTLHNMLDRIEKKGDLFISTLDASISYKNNTQLKHFL
jgi:bifunctional non-homologous end joining protein LigD